MRGKWNLCGVACWKVAEFSPLVINSMWKEIVWRLSSLEFWRRKMVL